MGWQWQQLNHVQIICTSLQTDNHASTSPLFFFTGQMPFLQPNQQRQGTEVNGTITINGQIDSWAVVYGQLHYAYGSRNSLVLLLLEHQANCCHVVLGPLFKKCRAGIILSDECHARLHCRNVTCSAESALTWMLVEMSIVINFTKCNYATRGIIKLQCM